MKLKLTHEESLVVLNVLAEGHEVSFNTKLESRLVGALLNDFCIKLMKKSMDKREKTTISLDNQTLLSLDHVFAQLRGKSDYQQAVLASIVVQINQACLSI